MCSNDLTGFAAAAAPDTVSAGLDAFDLDPTRYEGELAGFDLTPEQQRELLETLWSIMRRFVELGFSVKICGQVLGIDEQSAPPPADGVDSQGASDEAAGAPRERAP